MNYYPHHIGDFRSGTVNMSRQARWIYRDMMDIYYDTEKPLPLDLDVLCDMLGVETPDERAIVERLLRFKFSQTEDGYRNARCDQEIGAYQSRAETAKANGKRGGRPKKATSNPEKPSGLSVGSNPVAIGNPDQTGSQTNQEPVTKNQEPRTNKTGGVAAASLTHAPAREEDPAPPPLENVRIFEEKALAVAVWLRRKELARGKQPRGTQSNDPRIAAWIRAEVTERHLDDAYDLAVLDRAASGDTGPITPGFLDVFVAKVLRPPSAQSVLIEPRGPPTGRSANRQETLEARNREVARRLAQGDSTP